MRIASLEWDDDKQAFNKQEATLLVTTHSSANYLKIADEEGASEFVRYVLPDDHTLIMWTPRVELFEKAVASGALTGRVERKEYSTTVDITFSKEQVDNFIDPKRFTERFEFETPVVLTRIIHQPFGR